MLPHGRVLVQGITGHQGRFHSREMQLYGTPVVAGVTPGKGGQEVHGIPVYDSVAEAMEMKPDVSVVFVPATYAHSAVYEALSCGIQTVVVITEHIPLQRELDMLAIARSYGARIIGPNTPGYAIPRERFKAGIIPSSVLRDGHIAVISRSGTLTYEVLSILGENGFGESFCIGVGGDRVHGTTFVDALSIAEQDPETHGVVLIGEIGGSMEEKAAEFIRGMSKPVVGYIAGKSTPRGRRMGHAGAFVGAHGTAEEKIRVLEKAGVRMASVISDIPEILKEII